MEKRGCECIKYSELTKILKKNGCYIVDEGSNHTIWYSEKTGKKFPVPRHRSQDVRTGTLKAILRAAGLD